jgi:hypothetical protein
MVFTDKGLWEAAIGALKLVRKTLGHAPDTALKSGVIRRRKIPTNYHQNRDHDH